MSTQRATLLAVVVVLILAGSHTIVGQVSPSWTQWGGPHRDFMSDSKGLASSWHGDRSEEAVESNLGDGHSSILVESGRLYTMYRQITRQPRVTHDEIVAAIAPRAARRSWEFKYPAPTARSSSTRA